MLTSLLSPHKEVLIKNTNIISWEAFILTTTFRIAVHFRTKDRYLKTIQTSAPLNLVQQKGSSYKMLLQCNGRACGAFRIDV